MKPTTPRMPKRPSPTYSHEQARTDTVQHNLAVIVRHMEEAGIAKIEMEFDGYADEGNIHLFQFLDAGNQPLTALPEFPVHGLQKEALNEAAGPFEWTREASEPMAFAAAAVQLGLDLVEARHPGWDDGLGAKGAISISADETTIDFGERVEELKFTEDRYQPVEMPLPGAEPAGDAPSP